jgi:hypothetical protein
MPLNVIHASLLGFEIQAPFFANHLLIGGKVFFILVAQLKYSAHSGFARVFYSLFVASTRLGFAYVINYA